MNSAGSQNGMVLLADFGSTFTKLTAIDMRSRRVTATAKAFTTIGTNILDGFYAAFEMLKAECGVSDFEVKLAASSAAGGLKMVTVGLVPSLTVSAGKMAAMSAGAKLMKTYSYELSETEAKEIEAIQPDIILLSGGIDGGNKQVILHNAKILASVSGNFTAVIAGNKTVAAEAAHTLREKNAIVTENVMPVFGEINIQPAKTAIRNIFIERIVDAKGLTEAQKLFDSPIIPTPLACFNACEVFGAEGALTAVDVGGATTDVYSVLDGCPQESYVFEKGIKEPFAKRTVEGDLGVRYSLPHLISEYGLEKMAENLSIPQQDITAWSDTCAENPGSLPGNESESAADTEFAACAVEIAVSRHCGFMEKIYTPMGEMLMQTGKDLRRTKYLLGTGGSIAGSSRAGDILKRGLYKSGDGNMLKPLSPVILIDKRCLLTATGLLSGVCRETALHIMREEFIQWNTN